MQVRPNSASGTFDLDGTTIHRLGFGAMHQTGPGVWGPPKDRATAVAVLRRAVELGVDFIDTADAYGPGSSEEIIREALHPYPKGLLIATKAGLVRPGPERWVPCGRPDYLRQQCELSLRRLGLERIELFQLHRIDPTVPSEAQFSVLRELQLEGKVRHVGLSEVTIEEVKAAARVVRVATVQNRYNLVDRHSEPVLEHCQAEGIGFIPWFPLASGSLTSKGGSLDEMARTLNATASQLALAWLLARSRVMLPIPGTSSVSHCEENCAAGALLLAPEQLTRIERVARPS